MNIRDLPATALRKRRRILVRHLPPLELVLRGSLTETYKRCGRPNCHCTSGPGHGPKRYLVISQHGGEIEAVSPGQSQGSTFMVRLPLQPAEPAKEELLGHAAA